MYRFLGIKTKELKKIIAFVVIFFMCTTIMHDVRVNAETTSGGATFSDDFNDGNADGWTNYEGTWNASTGSYTVGLGTGYKSIANGTDFGNFIYETDISFSGGSDNNKNAGVIFRVSSPRTGADSLNGYYAGITYKGAVQVGRFDQNWNELANIPYLGGIKENTTYKLKVEAKGNNIDVYIDGNHVVSVVDKTYTHGVIGFRTWVTNVTYDNVSVTDTGDYTNPVYDWSNVKGAVFVPTNAVNEVQQWKFYDHDINDRELSYAHTYGINSVRVYLHYLNWLNDKDNFMSNIEDFLTTADKYGIRTEFVFFDDCWDEHPNWDNETADLAPKYGVHNSRWLECPGTDIKNVYNTDAEVRENLKSYVTDIVNAHKDDSRILFWNIYNEPGNGGTRSDVTKQLMNDGRIWIKNTGSDIPVSSTGREFVGDPFSDFITWHSYDNVYPSYANSNIDKSVLVDECMNRGRDGKNQSVKGIVDNYGKKGTGFIMWEFGIGRDNCRFAWDTAYTSDVAVPFHGVVYPDGHPWNTDDVKALLGDIDFYNLPIFNVNYYRDNNFSDLAKTSITPFIDFDLGNERGTGSPDATASIGEDNFSIRWQGYIKAGEAGTYTFYADSDNIARIWVGDKLIIDKKSNSPEEVTGNIDFSAEQVRPVKIEYVHATGDSSMHVSWSGPSMSKTVLKPIYVNNPVNLVKLNNNALDLLVDNKATLSVTIDPLDATNKGVTWRSSDESVVTVDAFGVVTAKGVGNAIITVTTIDGAKTDTCQVKVSEGAEPDIPSSAEVDDFDSATLNSSWTIDKEGSGGWSLAANPGFLRISNPGGDMWQTKNEQKNVFLQDAPSGDFEIITEVNSSVVKNYEQAGPIIWQDQDNYIRYGRVFDAGFGGKNLEFAKEISAVYSKPARENDSSYPLGDKVYMKITKVDNVYTAYFWDGSNWIQAAEPVTADLTNIKIGLYSTKAQDNTWVNADFDYFAVIPSKQEAAINSVKVEPSTADVIQGENKQLTAIVDSVGGALDTVTWSSSDADGKVSVDTNGLVNVAEDAAIGKYTITATSTEDSTKFGTAVITVVSKEAIPKIKSVEVTPSTADIVQGENKQLTAIVDAVGGAGDTVTWASSDTENKVTVDEDGLVNVAEDATLGDYTITVTSTEDLTKFGTSVITVIEAGGEPENPTELIITKQPTSQTVRRGDKANFSIEVCGTEPFNYQWQKDENDLADKDGLSGSETSNLIIESVKNSDSGDYSCIVTDGIDNVTTSSAVKLTVTSPSNGGGSKNKSSNKNKGSDTITVTGDEASILNAINNKDLKTIVINLDNLVRINGTPLLSENILNSLRDNPDKILIIKFNNKIFEVRSHERQIQFTQNGVVFSGFMAIGNAEYYLDIDGFMKIGWVKSLEDNKWYHLNTRTGIKDKNWFKDIDGYWYHLDKNTGAMEIRWIKDNGLWYYFDKISGEMKIGWIEDGGKWYYLYDNGSLAE